MDTKELRPDYIDLGKKIIEGLDAANYKTTAFFWILLPDAGWRLVVAPSDFNPNNPSASYGTLKEKLDAITNANEAIISQISIVEKDHPLVGLLRSAINTGDSTVSGIRFTNNVINGQVIEDAYLYRIS